MDPSEPSAAPEEARRARALLSVLEDLRAERQRLAAEIEQRRRAEEYVRSILDAALDAVVTIEETGRITGWNGQAERMFGWPQGEAIGQPLADLVIPERFRQAHRQGLARFLATGEGPVLNRRIELTAVRRGGEEFPVELAIAPLQVGAHYEFSAFVRDITDQKRAQDRLRLVVEAAPNAMIMVDRRGEMVLVNSETERLFGYPRDQLLGRPVEMLIPARLRSAHPGLREDFFRQPEARRMGEGRELFGLRRDGGEFPIEIGLNPIQTPEGLFVLSAIVDITERRRTDEMLRLAVEASPSGQVMIDEWGTIVLVNRAAEAMFGYAPGELIGQSVEVLVPPRFRPQHPQLRRDFFVVPQARAMGSGRDLYGCRKDGTEFPVEIGLNPIRTPQGTLVLSAIVDITERHRAEEEIRRVNQVLTQKHDEMQQFVYTVSHDLKSPLVTCNGFVGIIKEDAAAGNWPNVLDSLEHIARATARMSKLIDDLLKLSRLGTIPSEPEDVNLSALAREVADGLQARLEQVGAQLTIQDNMPRVRADRSRLGQLLDNLLGNAIKYGGPQPTIAVGAESRDGEVHLFVRDNGPGIPPQYHHKVFAPFQRLQTGGEGTGVGLAIVKRIAESQGGRAWVESKVGQGATFWVALPAFEAAVC